jgi:hypothetical protein
VRCVENPGARLGCWINGCDLEPDCPFHSEPRYSLLSL